MRVLIVAKTRMRSGACIGAISTRGRSLRLLPANDNPNSAFNLEYEIGDVWELDEYRFPPGERLIPPHVEDVIVCRKHRDTHYDDPSAIIEQIHPPQLGGIDALFDGLTQSSPSGSLYIAEGSGVPAYSTMFWRPDKPLVLDDSGLRLHYCYPMPGGVAKLAYVGFQDPLAEIPAGTLVRVSLAHWWRPPEATDQELRCHCQLSGWLPLELGDGCANGGANEVDSPAGKDLDIGALLKSVFGYEDFRGLQEEIIRGLLDGKDALAIMPTGGGKSLCYQLAAVALGGVAVVVSPLISLMQDQVDALLALDIPATFLNSTLGYADYVARQQLVRQNQVRLLYIAPETLARPETLHLLQNSAVTLLAIDEAHCISEWGHDFRPEYRRLGEVRRKLPGVPCVALTATATSRVQRDIIRNLAIDPERSYVGDLDRPNLFLEVQMRATDGVRQVADFINERKGQSGIVYCSTRAGADELGAALDALGISALPYHAGLDDDVRLRNQTRFIRDDVDVIVATIAFGMGIDKSNIRFVVHYNLPDCLDKYYQQIGRAGRDGLRSDCLLLHAPADLHTIRYHIRNMAPAERRGARYRLDQMQAWVASQSCRRIGLLRYFGQEVSNAECGMCDRCAADDPDVSGGDDLSEYARLFLSCIFETGQRFGKSHIIQVLRGSRSEKVLRWNHDKVATYGAGRGLSNDGWRDLANQFIDRGLVTTGEMYVLGITERGQSVIDGEAFFGHAPSTRRAAPAASRDGARSELQYDAALFEKLRVLRKSIADETNLPAYTIFHDSSLREMAAFCPTNLEDFRDIRGVGNAKADKYGERFLDAIAHHGADASTAGTKVAQKLHDGSEIDAPELRPRTRQVVACYLEAASLGDAAEQLGIAPATVIGHLDRYLQAGYDLPLEPLVAESTLGDDDREQVFELFAEANSDELKPIFEHFKREISYLELRILLLWYHANNQGRADTF